MGYRIKWPLSALGLKFYPIAKGAMGVAVTGIGIQRVPHECESRGGRLFLIEMPTLVRDPGSLALYGQFFAVGLKCVPRIEPITAEY